MVCPSRRRSARWRFAGKIPAFDPTNDDMSGGLGRGDERSTSNTPMPWLPKARIVIAATPMSEDEGLSDMPKMMKSTIKALVQSSHR